MATKPAPASQLDFLTPGSIWIRDDERIAKFLFLTNTSLKAKTQLRHPPQIIYADAEGNIFNRDVDDFFTTYQFHSVDGELEAKVNALFVFSEGDYEESEESDETDETDETDDVEDSDEATDLELREAHSSTLADNLAMELANTIEAKTEAPAIEVGFQFAVEGDLTPSPLSAQDLTDAVVLYGQDPNGAFSLTQHRLLFRLSEKITLESLKTAFAPSEERSTVDAFEVRTQYGTNLVYWSHWLGVYPEYSASGLFASVLTGTEDDPVAVDTPESESLADAVVETPLSEAEQQVPEPAVAAQVPAETPQPTPEVIQPFSQQVAEPSQPAAATVVTTTPKPAVTPIITPVVTAVKPNTPAPNTPVTNVPQAK